MKIGELSRRCGVGIETIRYYERRGLIDEPARSDSGYRQYPAQAVDRLRFIVGAKDLGFTLDEIVELLSISVGSGPTDGGERAERRGKSGDRGRLPRPRDQCDRVRLIAEEKRSDVQERIEKLTRIRDTLDKLIAACRRNEATGACPIIHSLAE